MSEEEGCIIIIIMDTCIACIYVATYECFAWICNCTYMAKYEIPCGSFAGNNKRNDVDEKQNSSQSNELVQIRAGQTDQPVRIIVHVYT